MSNAIIEAARNEGRTILSEIEAKQLLESAGVPVSPARLAETKDDAVKLAGELGYPIVLKIVSPQITHKSDVGGVALGLTSADEVGAAFERVVANAKKADAAAERQDARRRTMPANLLWALDLREQARDGWGGAPHCRTRWQGHHAPPSYSWSFR